MKAQKLGISREAEILAMDFEQKLSEAGTVFARLASVGADVSAAAKCIDTAISNGGRLLVFGNGGSASDANHFAAELAGRYLIDRPGLPGISLASNVSALTAIGNDYGFETVFERQLDGLVSGADVVVAISTSGNSENCVRGVRRAAEAGAATIALTGKDGGTLAEVSDIAIRVPSSHTPRIQEMHICVIHTICEYVEAKRAGSGA